MDYDYNEYLNSLIVNIKQEKTIDISDASFDSTRGGDSFEVVGGSVTNLLSFDKDPVLDAVKKIEFAFSDVTNKTLESMASDVGGILGFYPRESYANIVKALARTGAISKDIINGINLDSPTLDVDDFISLIQSGITLGNSLKNDNSFSSLNKGRHDLLIKDKKTKFDEEKSDRELENNLSKESGRVSQSFEKSENRGIGITDSSNLGNQLEENLSKEDLSWKYEDNKNRGYDREEGGWPLEQTIDGQYSKNELSTSLTEEKPIKELSDKLEEGYENNRRKQDNKEFRGYDEDLSGSKPLEDALNKNYGENELSTSLTEKKSDKELENNLSKEDLSWKYEDNKNRGYDREEGGWPLEQTIDGQYSKNKLEDSLGEEKSDKELENNLSKEDLSWKYEDNKNRGYDREEGGWPLEQTIDGQYSEKNLGGSLENTKSNEIIDILNEEYVEENLKNKLEKESKTLGLKKLDTDELLNVFTPSRPNMTNIYENLRNSDNLKTTGYIYVMPVNSNVLSSNATAFKIPLQNNLVFQDDNIKAEYNTINFLNRVGSVVQYVRVDSRTMDVETSYFVETSKQVNKLAYFTMEKLQRIESMYKSLVHPQKISSGTGENSMLLSRPPIINIVIGGDGNNDIVLENETDERQKQIRPAKASYNVVNNLFTSPSWGHKENGLPNDTGNIYYRSFVVSDLSIRKEADTTPYYMEKDRVSGNFRPKDFAGFSVRLTLLEIDPNYIGVNPTFEDFMNFGSRGLWGVQQSKQTDAVSLAAVINSSTPSETPITAAFIRGTPL